jgi:Ca-activated chloride channel family protein
MLKKITLFFGLALVVSAWQTPTQPYTFEGTVLEKNTGSPMIGASVLIKGTTQGTVTDFDGKFSLDYHQKKATLVVSYTGYKSQEVKATAGQPLTVKMEAAQVELDEVVVGYSIRERAPADGRRFEMRAKRMPATAGYVSGAVAGDGGPPHNTEDYDVINENRFYEVTKEPLSTFSIDVDAASYSNIRRFLRNGQQPPKDAVRIEEMVNYFNYEYPEPAGEHPFTVNTEISECPWQPQHRLLHVGLQGRHIPTDELPASNLVFLIDVSGSMSAANKLPLLQSSFKLLADQLRPTDKVAIVVYAGAAGIVLEPTGGDDKQKIKDAIHQLQAGGSTAGGAGLQLAYKVAKEYFVRGGNNRVILATDGDFNVGASSDAELVRMIEQERESGVFLTVLGFGMGNYKDNKMQQLADKGNGNHAYIDDISEAKKVLIEEFGGTMFAIAKDVKIQIEFNPAKVRGYRLIGYENRLLANEDFHDDKKDAGELGSGHTVTALYEIIPAGVDSEHLAEVDDLKYQETKIDPKASKSKEMLTIKLRYKAPDGARSRLIEQAVLDRDTKPEKASDNFRWAAAVAEFGMLLRDSEYKGKTTYLHCQRLAESAKGDDPNGYRREFIEMIDTMKRLADPDVAGKE